MIASFPECPIEYSIDSRSSACLRRVLDEMTDFTTMKRGSDSPIRLITRLLYVKHSTSRCDNGNSGLAFGQTPLNMPPCLWPPL